MKKTILLSIIALGTIAIAQEKKVGINTDSPQTTLDVNGDVNVSGAIYLGGDDLSAGTLNQIVTSGGEEVASWTNKEIPFGMDMSLKTSFMDSYSDTTGIEFDNNSTGNTNPYDLDDLLNHGVGWEELTGLESSFTVYKNENRLKLFFQTMIQFEGNSLASFGCGYFINDNMQNRNQFRLKGVRTDVMQPPSGSFKLFNMNFTNSNLEPATYTVKIACIKRNIGGINKISIGKPLTNVLNTEMSQSSLNISVLEEY